eukprot:m.549734 g.549734  ORF g.549734 m.549734 type:complete len:57 (-) comp57727_c0_seq2:121-291(-)
MLPSLFQASLRQSGTNRPLSESLDSSSKAEVIEPLGTADHVEEGRLLCVAWSFFGL